MVRHGAAAGQPQGPAAALALCRPPLPFLPGQRSAPYTFQLDYNPGAFTIKIFDGSTTLATISLKDSTYTKGKFGFYNYSQNAVTYEFFNFAGIP